MSSILSLQSALIYTYASKCRIYASMNHASIGSDSGLSRIRRQAIIWTSAGLFSPEPLGTNFNEILPKIQNLFHENASENIAREKAAILSRGECVKTMS